MTNHVLKNLYLKKLEWRLRGSHKRISHPKVMNSWVGEFSLIDRTATVSNSRLYGLVTVGQHAVIEQCHISGAVPVEIGAYSSLTGPILAIADINPIRIGKFCSLAPHVGLWEAHHHSRRMSTYHVMSSIFGEPLSADVNSKGPITIGNDVWIGTGAKILSGVTIGDGAIIGAGSIVTRDVGPYMIAGGAPATDIRPRFPDAIRERLQALRWWDWGLEKIQRNRALFVDDLTDKMLDNIT